MTKIPPDDILEGLYKVRIRVSDKLKTVLELYDLEIHQKNAGPDYHRLKTMVECPDIWIRLPRHKCPKSWSSKEDPVVPLERNLYGHPLAGLLWERQFEKVLLKHGWEKIPNWECLFVHREKGLFLSVYVDDIKLAGKKHNIDPMWKVLNKKKLIR